MPVVETIGRFRVIKHHMPTPVVSVRIIVNSGSIQDVRSGTAHFLEHMIFKGTAKRSYEEMNRLIAAIGSTNAYTDNDRTAFYIDTTPDKILEALGYLCEMAFTPSLDQDEFERERNVILEERQRFEDDPASHFFGMTETAHFGPILGRETLGERQDILDMTLDDLKVYKAANYTAQNVVVALVGDLSANPDLSIVLDQYVLEPGTPNSIPTIESDTGTWASPKTHLFQHAADQAYVALLMPGLAFKDSCLNHHADDIAQDLIGGGMHSLAFLRLREEKGLCYDTAMFEMGSWDNGTAVLYAATNPKNVEDACVEMKKIIEDVADGKFTDAQLMTSVSHVLFNLANGAQTSSGYAWMFVDKSFYRGRSIDLSEQTLEHVKARIGNCRFDKMRQLVQDYARRMMTAASFSIQTPKN